MEIIFSEMIKIVNMDTFVQWFIVTILCACSLEYIDLLLLKKLFVVKTNKKQEMLIITIGTILRVIITMLIPAPYYRIITTIIDMILYKKILKQTIEKSILISAINLITVMCMEALFAKLYCEIFKNIEVYQQGMYSYKYKFCLIMSISIVRVIIYNIVDKRKITINIKDNINKKIRNNIIIISIIEESLIFFNTIEMTIYITKFPFSILVLDLIALIIFYYMSIKNFIILNALEERDLKINNLQSYNKTLSIMYDSIRGFRHDYSNTIQALNGYAQIGDTEVIKDMCNSMLQECRDVNNMGILDPEIINNPGVYSILTNKYYLARENNIKMNVEVMINIHEIKMSNYELCKILAILLDNAIDAAKECDEKVINVKFIKDYKVNRNLIIIENSYDEVDIDLDKIYEKGYTSKKDSAEKHGLGLWTVRKILSNNNNLNLFTSKNDLFCQQLEIYDM